MIDIEKILSVIKKVTNDDLTKNIIKYDKIKLIDRINTEPQVKSIINSLNDNQTKSKYWLMEKTESFFTIYDSPKVCVAAGWYGHLANMIYNLTGGKVISFDKDPLCEEIGKRFYNTINFQTIDIIDFDCSEFDVIVCTSCEHIPQAVLDSFIDQKNKTATVILQSNNYHTVPDHINYRNSLQSFVDDYKRFKIQLKDELILDNYTRYMVVFK